MNSAKLKGKIVERGTNYSKCANAIGKTPQTFCAKMNNRGYFDLDEVEKLSEYLELNNTDKIEIFLT